MTRFSRHSLDHAATACGMIMAEQIDRVAGGIAAVRNAGGRLFVLGVGGSAGNAGLAVNGFRKLCDVPAHAPTDNVAELTAHTNDEGWETRFARWLPGRRVEARAAILVNPTKW